MGHALSHPSDVHFLRSRTLGVERANHVLQHLAPHRSIDRRRIEAVAVVCHRVRCGQAGSRHGEGPVHSGSVATHSGHGSYRGVTASVSQIVSYSQN